MSCSDLTPVSYENVFRIQDQTNAITLAQGGWHKANAPDINSRAYNIMGILEAPPASNIDLAVEMIGGGPGAPGTPGWEHIDSSITVIRLEAFFSSGFDADPSLNQASPGDIALVRFDFNIIPQFANTTVEVALIWATRDSNDDITFTFPLTAQPLFFGTGTVGNTYLNRPLLTAYFASDEDVNARALLAVKADQPVLIQPLTTLATIVR